MPRDLKLLFYSRVIYLTLIFLQMYSSEEMRRDIFILIDTTAFFVFAI